MDCQILEGLDATCSMLSKQNETFFSRGETVKRGFKLLSYSPNSLPTFHLKNKPTAIKLVQPVREFSFIICSCTDSERFGIRPYVEIRPKRSIKSVSESIDMRFVSHVIK